LAAKIEESQTAADLVHRIRDVTKKVRLAAPAIDGKGMGLDPNTVAEYLDNTLTGESTPDFEMVCLESDVHLAEVAACHEILSLVLVQPVEIDPATRTRMYGLLNEAAAHVAKIPTAPAAPIAPVAMAVPQAAAAVPVADGKAKREVPAYLKNSVDEAVMARRGWMLAASALAALILVATTFALAAIPLESLPEFLRPLANTIFPREVEVAVEPAKPPKRHTDIPLVPVPTATSDSSAPAVASTAGASATAGNLSVVPNVAATGTAIGLLQPPSAVSPSANPTPSPTGIAPIPPVPSAVASVTAAAPVAPAATPEIPLAAPTATPSASAVALAPASALPTPSSTATPVVPAVATPDIPAKIEPVGRVNSAGSQVLLRFDSATGAWVRLPARETLLVGDRLLALPAYRPQIALGNGLTIDLLGGTLVELRPIDAGGTPGILLLRGRLMAFNVGGTKGALRLENGTSVNSVALTSAELGIEFVPRRLPGQDPLTAVSSDLALYGKSGQISWWTATQAESPLTMPGQWLITADAAPAPLPATATPPTWLVSDERDLLEKQAADSIELGLRSDKAVSVALREMLGDRRIENVQLALRCLAQLGEYEDFTPLLRDPTQRYSTWERYVQMLAEALDYGPEYAGKVRDSLVKQHGPNGEPLFRILWGYSDEQLKNGAAQYLIETLDHPELEFRIFAIWTLCDITGQPPGGYQPQDPQARRKAAILKWEQKLKEGQIVGKKV
jgi:hypothetical protein